MANAKYTTMRNCPMDSKMVGEIQASPRMLAEQGGSVGFLSRWGGAENYKVLSRATPEMRVAYFAVIDGVNTEPDIANQTGLTAAEVKKAVAALKAQGLIKESDVPAAGVE